MDYGFSEKGHWVRNIKLTQLVNQNAEILASYAYKYLRNNTILINPVPKLESVVEFIAYSVASADENLKDSNVENFLVVSHGNSTGRLFLEFDFNLKATPRQKHVEYFEYMQKVSDVDIQLNNFPDYKLKEYYLPILYFNLTACNIGNALPVVIEMKKRLKGRLDETKNPKEIFVIAAKHNYMFQYIPNIGILEYLRYDFKVYSHNKIITIDNLIKLFKESKLKDVYGNIIEDNVWDELNVFMKKKKRFYEKKLKHENKKGKVTKFRAFFQKKFSLKEEVQTYIGKKKTLLSFSLMFQRQEDIYIENIDLSRLEKRSLPIWNPITLFEKELIDWLINYYTFHDNKYIINEFPLYKRLGFESTKDFIHGYKWSVSAKNMEENYIQIEGKRIEYSYRYPILYELKNEQANTDSQKKYVPVNLYYFPKIKNKYSLENIKELDKNDTKLFVMV